MSDVEMDNIIVNLKVLANLEQNRKLNTCETFLNVEGYNPVYPEFIRRYIRGDNRDETIKKIDNVISNAINLIDENKQLIEFLTNARKGIINLKETYSKCDQTKARLDTIIVKIDNAVE